MSKEELKKLKEKVEDLQEELEELTDEELEQIVGGSTRVAQGATTRFVLNEAQLLTGVLTAKVVAVTLDK